ncbi:PP2C family protein-serine/threonine phosphatase [Actinomadura algeriensis]|uniref:Serine phosphatase RsbU (Regulator of sigma subunit) n=1 Tax=Actinomadura algeriensis TaxID=1679523 RepID=A0ABR9K0V2_9ACTN|nr:PP2C family protein-serine/threonine phosphatase [Actinomadura algeriensis]MBE1536249.1 serine phosphatase RsbU (regulator of sigma subunit) [Actinomadura algeriensis]
MPAREGGRASPRETARGGDGRAADRTAARAAAQARRVRAARADALAAGEAAAADRRRLRAAGERRVAVELQRAVLPLPRGVRGLPGLRVAVRYLPARSENRVGGDWYEAAALAPDEVLLAVGDVSGHGPPAAAEMARLRGALGGLARTGASPGALLGWLNGTLGGGAGDPADPRTASVVAARYRPGPRLLTWARAGHPPPVLLRGRRARPLDAPGGVLLGVPGAPRPDDAETRLHRDDLLLLYTDGLVARRGRDPAEGLALLCRAAAQRHASPPDAVVDHVLRSLGAANPDDDICVLAARVT